MRASVLLPVLLLALTAAPLLGQVAAISDLNGLAELRQVAISTAEKIKAGGTVQCLECEALIGSLIALIHENVTLETMENIAIDVCITTEMFLPDVCRGMVEISAGEVIYVLTNTIHSIATVCTVFSSCDSPLPSWTITVPGGKPPVGSRAPNPDAPASIRVLHISDSHYDPLYQEGSPAECGHPAACCRPWGDTSPVDPVLAGRWGAEAGDCDAPLRTFEAALEAAVALQPDIIYMTGDQAPHDVWMQSHASMVETVTNNSAIFLQHFPSTPTAYTLGNHEAAPVNSYAVPAAYSDGYDMDWLYSTLQQVWGEAGAQDTVAQGGYYSWSPFAGLRVIAINDMYGWHQNWFMLLEHEDPTGQLQWLADELTAAEAAGDRVHLLSHVTPGGLMSSFSHALNLLISRFENTITGVFCGHSHSDQLQLMWQTEDNTMPVAVAYIAPSISSNGKKSPSFRIYEVDGGYADATWELTNTLTYSMNLTLANLGDTPAFELAYTAQEAYQLTDMSPTSWADAVWKMASDVPLYNVYLGHRNSFLADAPEIYTCDTSCRASDLCGMSNGDKTDSEPCERIRDETMAHP